MIVYVLRGNDGMYYADGCPTPSLAEARKFTLRQNALQKANWVLSEDPDSTLKVMQIKISDQKFFRNTRWV